MKTSIARLTSRIAERFPSARRMPEPLKRLLRRYLLDGSSSGARTRTGTNDAAYASRLAAEKQIFEDQVEVNDLPAIFHYWSNTYLRPKLERFGFSDPDGFFATFLARSVHDHQGTTARFASVGAGNCDTEVRVAKRLLDLGVRDFTIECIDINATMLARGHALAEEAGVGAHIRTHETDFNAWKPSPGSFAAIMANQSLHHVVQLETLFDAITRGLDDDGRFLTSDMIGRNGHMRWPEALAIVDEFWRELPEAYRWNRQLKRHEASHGNWDCSGEGFEGIRAQDILPLLVERFDFEFFLGYGNVIDPFVDRSFGGHFDPDREWDRDFIDRVHARDEAEMLAGTIKPTHIMAAMRKRPFAGTCAHLPGLPPAQCVRDPRA